MKTRLVVFLFLLVPGRKVIAAPRLILWHPQDTSFNIVLPALESETPREAVQKYVNAMNETPEFRYEMMKGAMVQIPESSFQEFTARKVDPSFLVLANEINQIEGNTYYMNLVVGILRQKQADPFVLPVGADFRLSVADRKKVKLLVNTTFDAELALGGEDADPALYNEPNRYTQPQDIHPLRDRLEADFIRSYLKAGKGVFYAICRGHQLTNASLGSHLIQDLYAENLTETEHRGGTFHTIFIEPDSLMSRMTGGLTEITVNSLHHQAIRDMPADWKISAIEHGGGFSQSIVEAAESKKSCALTMQFHPEGMNVGIGGKILWEMVQYAREIKASGRKSSAR